MDDAQDYMCYTHDAAGKCVVELTRKGRTEKATFTQREWVDLLARRISGEDVSAEYNAKFLPFDEKGP